MLNREQSIDSPLSFSFFLLSSPLPRSQTKAKYAIPPSTSSKKSGKEDKTKLSGTGAGGVIEVIVID